MLCRGSYKQLALMTLVNIQGQIVKSHDTQGIGWQTLPIDISQLLDGIYSVNLLQDDAIVSSKQLIVKNKSKN